MKKHHVLAAVTAAALGAGTLAFTMPALAGSTTIPTMSVTDATETTQERGQRDGNRTKGWGKGKAFGELVENGTLSQEQADAIKTQFKENSPERPSKAERQAQWQKLKDMTAEERATFFAEKKAKKLASFKTNLDALVKNGTITQAQADAVNTQLQERAEQRTPGMRGHGNHGKGKRGHGKMFHQLVDDGTLSQEKVDAIKTHLKENRPERPSKADRQAQWEQLKAMTPEERTAFFAEKKAEKLAELKTKLDTLVEAGTITQTEADKVVAHVTEQAKKGGGKKGFRSHRGGGNR